MIYLIRSVTFIELNKHHLSCMNRVAKHSKSALRRGQLLDSHNYRLQYDLQPTNKIETCQHLCLYANNGVVTYVDRMPLISAFYQLIQLCSILLTLVTASCGEFYS